MRFEYKDSLINQIIKRDNVLGIEFIYVDKDEMMQIMNELEVDNHEYTFSNTWISLENYDFVIYLEQG